MGGVARRFGWLAAAAGGLALGCVSLGDVDARVESAVFLDQRDEGAAVQMITTNIQGKNVYVPSTVVVGEGSGRTLSIFNTTDTPHGFRIASLGVEAVLMHGQETKIVLPPLSGGTIHEIDCQLHPPHRHATLVVVHTR